MGDGEAGHAWCFRKFGLFVTGKGEEQFLGSFLRCLTHAGTCTFEVISRVPQRSPRTSPRRQLSVVGTDKAPPTKDLKEIGLPARNYLDRNPGSFVLLVDDLEHERRGQRRETFKRYQEALGVLPATQRHRASVHFLVNMVEAYYFADTAAVNDVLGTDLRDAEDDVEDIRHPKARLRALSPGFHEVDHGGEIVRRLDLEKVLSNPDTCASLRALLAWCSAALREPDSDRFQLTAGKLCEVTGPQVTELRRWQ